MAIQCAWNLDTSVHWGATREIIVGSQCFPVCFQWPSSGVPVCSYYANYHWITTGTPLGASISQWGSSGIPGYLWLQWFSSVFQLCKLTLDRPWNTTGCWHPPVWFQWHPSVLAALVFLQWYPSILTESGLEVIRSGHFLACKPYVYNWYGDSCLSSTDFIWLASPNTQKL